MYKYHSELTATHPYSSPWWSWPLMLRPMWYYTGGAAVNGLISCISAFGNPAIWWGGVAAFWISIPVAIVKKDKRLALLIIGYLSQYLPWMLVPRIVFIYHYFASVPFVIMIIVFLFQHLEKASPKFKKITYAYIGLTLVLFCMFYPVISGVSVSRDYVMHALRWFDSWVFFT